MCVFVCVCAGKKQDSRGPNDCSNVQFNSTFTIQANTILFLFTSPKHKVTLHEPQPAEEGRTGIQLWLAART